jgi:hypothetical protein
MRPAEAAAELMPGGAVSTAGHYLVAMKIFTLSP